MQRVKLDLTRQEHLVRNISFAIIDFRDVAEDNITPSDIRELARIDMVLAKMTPNAVIAVVAPKDHLFGIARMWETLVEDTGWSTRVFRCCEQAYLWAGMERDAATSECT